MSIRNWRDCEQPINGCGLARAIKFARANFGDQVVDFYVRHARWKSKLS